MRFERVITGPASAEPAPELDGPPAVLRISAVVVAHGPEPWLEPCVHAILASTGVQVDIVLVDNGGTNGLVEHLAAIDGITVLHPGANVGFAKGCNLGVEASTAPVVALVNPDALVAPDALAELAAVALRPSVGLVTASVRLADDPDLLNSGGNEIHFLGMSWAGRYGQPAAAWPTERAVTAASGAAMACRRSVWNDLGGFEERFFAYLEDAELSLRTWQHGLEVRYVPTSVVRHRYEFSRNAAKLLLLERNRLLLVLTCFGDRMLLLILPALALFEILMLFYSAVGGWLPQKLAGYRWLVRRLRWLRGRRHAVQSARCVTDRHLAHLFDPHLRPGNYPLPRWLIPLDCALAGYWAVIRRLLD